MRMLPTLTWTDSLSQIVYGPTQCKAHTSWGFNMPDQPKVTYEDE